MSDDLSADQRARLQAEDGQRRLSYLYEATSTLFSEPLDVSRRLVRFAALLVPDLGDWCWIDVVEGGGLRRAVTHHWNATLLSERIVSAPDVTIQAEALRVVRSGCLELSEDVSDPSQCQDAPVAIRSLLRVPLRDDDEIIGVLSIGFAESNRQYRSEDADLVVAIALRAGWALQAARQYERATRATAAREDVLAVVAHDLRGPLGTILLGADMLRKVTDSEVVDRIVRSGVRMERLIRDLLDWSSLESGHLNVEIAPFSVAALMSDVREGLEPQAVARSQVLHLDFPVEDIEVAGDRSRTYQVIANLVGNAIKFTPSSGAITVRAELEPNFVRIVVEDEGPGIAPEHLAHVFERYWQADAGTRQRHGIGLGLAIARGIVLAQGGTIVASNRAGSGAQIAFTLPLAATRD